MHRTRVITGIIGLAALISVIRFGNPSIFWLVVSSAIVVGLLEFYKIVQARDFPVYLLPGVLSGWLLSLVPLASISFTDVTLTGFTVALIVLLLFLYALLSKQPLEDSIQALALTLFGIFYVSWLLTHLIFIRKLPNGLELVFALLLIVWSGDTGAYYTGSFFGKHKLAPRISPKKTIEGSLGGLTASILTALIAKLIFKFPLLSLSYLHCFILGLLLGVIAQSGDLCASMLKRAANV
ncbi:MAG: CDP-archaeol synthase, partial [Planctomycetaceae bacterium]|nr:CDP-archaeol synthase [Planctomycetaceae bacterium]